MVVAPPGLAEIVVPYLEGPEVEMVTTWVNEGGGLLSRYG